jgi:uncharacterized membrane protein (DUF106 family)
MMQVEPSAENLPIWVIVTMGGVVSFLFSIILKILYDSIVERKTLQAELNETRRGHSAKIEEMVAANKAEVKKLTDQATEADQNMISILHDQIKFHEKIAKIKADNDE